jgi:hypothetical protein
MQHTTYRAGRIKKPFENSATIRSNITQKPQEQNAPPSRQTKIPAISAYHHLIAISASLILGLLGNSLPVVASGYNGTKLMVYQNIVSGNNQNPTWDFNGGGSTKAQRTIQIKAMPSGWDNAVSAVAAWGMGCQVGLFADPGFNGTQWREFVPYAYLLEDGSMVEGFLGYDDMRKVPPGNDNISSIALVCPDYGGAGLFLSSGVNGQPAMRGQDWLPGYAQSAWNYESGVLEVANLGAQSSIGNDAAAALYAWGQDCKIRLYRDDNFSGSYVDIWTDSETQTVTVPDLGLLPNVGRNQASSFRMECRIKREW